MVAIMATVKTIFSHIKNTDKSVFCCKINCNTFTPSSWRPQKVGRRWVGWRIPYIRTLIWGLTPYLHPTFRGPWSSQPFLGAGCLRLKGCYLTPKRLRNSGLRVRVSRGCAFKAPEPTFFCRVPINPTLGFLNRSLQESRVGRLR